MTSNVKKNQWHPRAIRTNSYCKGQSLVEIVIALGIFVIITSGIITLSLGSLISERQGGEITQATFFMQQGAEATRSIQDLAYNKLAYYSDGLTHGLDNSSGVWEWSGLNNIKDQFTRTIKIEDVTRDTSGNIGAGINDLETKKITVSSDWAFALGRANQVQSIFYLTNWNRGLWVEDTVADFSDGIFNDTYVSNDFGGEIKLAKNSNTTWQCGTQSGTLNLPSVVNATDVVTVGNISYVTTLNNTSGAEFYIIDVFNPASLSILGSLNIGTAANGVFVSGNYAYVATNSDSQELMVIDITNPGSLSINGSYDADFASNANNVFVDSGYAYLVTNINNSGGPNPEFYVLDVSTPTSPSLEGSLDIGANIFSAFYDNNKVYVSSSNNSAEMNIVDVSTKNNPNIIGSYDAPSSFDGTDTFASGNTAYLTTNDNGIGDEFYVLNVTNPGSITVIGSYNVNGNALSVFVDPGATTAFIGNSQSLQQFKVIDITTPSSPTLLKSFNANGNVRSVYFANNKVYLTSDSGTQEFQIFQPNTGNSWDCIKQTGIYDSTGLQDATDVNVVAVSNRAYITTVNNAAGNEFYILDISTPSTPTLLGSLDLNADANALYINGNYAYIATSSDNQELMVVNITNPGSLSINGSYDADSNVDATDVFVSGNYAYLTTKVNSTVGINPEFYILDITTPTNPALTGYLEPDTNVNSVFYSNDKAYLATIKDIQELIIVDVTNKAIPAVAGIYDAPTGIDASAVWVNGNTAYFVRKNMIGSNPEFQVLDVTNPASVFEIGSLDLQAAGLCIYVDNNHAFVGTSATDQEAQIIDISNPASPSRINSIDANGDVNGISSAVNAIYLATANNSEEFQIWSQVATYQTFGTYESSEFGPVSNFNLIKWTENIPSVNEDLLVQIKTAPDNAGVPGVWYSNWCGPLGKIGNDTNFFTDSNGQIINPNMIGDNWIKYKLTLTGNGTDTPALRSHTVNYKP
ncbi:MAG: hypothetical protein WC663_01340 [Patescibacteria group bacterium]|jgi:hypothetical protein